MKYRMLFLIKLGYYLYGKKITINTEMYSLLYAFVLNYVFSYDEEVLIDKMMQRKNGACLIKYKEFNDSYETIKKKFCLKDNFTYDEISPKFYLDFSQEELVAMNRFVWYFYNFYSKYIEVLSNGKDHIGPYDSKIYTRTHFIS